MSQCVHMSVGVLWGPGEDNKSCSWTYKQLWAPHCGGSHFLQKQQVLLTAEPSLQSLHLVLKIKWVTEQRYDLFEQRKEAGITSPPAMPNGPILCVYDMPVLLGTSLK